MSKGASKTGSGGSVTKWVTTIFVTLLISPFAGGCGAAIANVWSDGNPVVTISGAVVMILFFFLIALFMVSVHVQTKAMEAKRMREDEEIRQSVLRIARKDES